ncbi:MAG: glutamine-hydrolyzing carbamoyl-phosphate synthase small subunit [Spirochaetes bacterium]|nr:glutamine-hydrolyzing carbamoyl-phosphate synthase small subunit [Spirochaetota bacterium]
MSTPAALALESGEVFHGLSIGSEGEAYGEAVFNTSMSGYQEILTDPSYRGQIISMTYPEIGNYGVNEDDNESAKIHASGFVVKHYCDKPSHFRASGTLSSFLKRYGIVALQGVDTRRLTRILRSTGAKRSVISTVDLDPASLVAKAKASQSIEHRDLVREVSTEKAYDWPLPEGVAGRYRVAVYDFGVKWNILRSLASRGAVLRVFPASTAASEILAWKPDGVFLSNGPGDPSALLPIVEQIKLLLGKRPVFGICLGHQLIGQAYGATTFKLKFGHRGGNQPVQRKDTGGIEITSQNHGFAVRLAEAGRDPYVLSHVNSNDQTLEGLVNDADGAFSVQYHPEASPGPHDSLYLFDRFLRLMDAAKGGK